MARINWWTFKCATCGHTDRRPNHPTTLQCADCGESMRSSGGNGGGGIGSVHAAQRAFLNYEISGSNVTAPAQPIGWVMAMACGIARGVGDDAVTFECGFCKSTHHYAKAPSSYECRVCGGWPDAAAGSGNDGVDGLDRYTCWVRWHQNRNSIEGGRGYAIHPLTDAQIVAAKLVQSQDWDRERMMNPPKTSKPKITILVDQDIED